MGVTSKELLEIVRSFDVKKVSGKLPQELIQEKDMLTDIITQTSLSMKEAEFKIQRLLDTSQNHTQLYIGPSHHVRLLPGIPQCFKIDLQDQTIPLKIFFRYKNGEQAGRQPPAAVEAQIVTKLVFGGGSSHFHTRKTVSQNRRVQSSKPKEGDFLQPELFFYGSFNVIGPDQKNCTISRQRPEKIVLEDP